MATLSLEEDHYVVLGVRSDCDDSTVKAAWRAAARRYHPDAGGSAEDFARVRWAWEVLGDPQQRAEYDRQQRVRTTGPTRSSTQGDRTGQPRSSTAPPRSSSPSNSGPRTSDSYRSAQASDAPSRQHRARTSRRTWTFPSAVAVLIAVFAAGWSLVRPDLPEWILGHAELQSWMAIQQDYALVPLGAAVLSVVAFGLSVRWRGWSWLTYPLAGIAVLLGAGALLAGVITTIMVGVGVVVGFILSVRILLEMFSDDSPSS